MPHIIDIRASPAASAGAAELQAAIDALIEGAVGPPMIGTVIAGILFGIFVVQAYIYYRNFPLDRMPLKIMVILVCLIEVVHMGLVTAGTYEMTVLSFNHPQRLYSLPLGLSVGAYMMSLMHFIIPLFLVFRIHVLTKSRWLVVILAPLAVARGVISVTLNIIQQVAGTTVEFAARYKWLVLLSLSIGVVTDLVLSGIMVVLLYRAREKSISKETGRMMGKLILYTVESGAITAFLTLIVLVALPQSKYVWIGFLIVIPKVYANTLMASLNGRMNMKSEHTAVSVSGADLDFAAGSRSGPRSGPLSGVSSFITTLSPNSRRTSNTILIQKASDVYTDRSGPNSPGEKRDHELILDEQMELKAMH
ncbi:hypothetical protein BDV98DRAFT_582865 [Pterulicium gracile]|uniref:DUF6534 domain-containing protein n=1 Tax=Pterulicium gracile TaxID=1884261 RepID=A0A5C3QGQ6_9AGAR|nr:hypothetical protein BDV98DRAFT_582865 [Pterula gracilis]